MKKDKEVVVVVLVFVFVGIVVVRVVLLFILDAGRVIHWNESTTTIPTNIDDTITLQMTTTAIIIFATVVVVVIIVVEAAVVENGLRTNLGLERKFIVRNGGMIREERKIFSLLLL